MRALAVAMVVAGLVGSALGALAWRSYLEAQSSRTFASTAATVANALELELERDADLTATGRAFVETVPQLSNEGFASWFHLLGTKNTYPGSFGLLYIEDVRPSGLAAFASTVAHDPPLGLPASGPFSLSPAGAKAPYCLTRAGVTQLAPTAQLSPLVVNSLLAFVRPDLDYCALPIGRMMLEAASSGEATAFPLASLIAKTPHMAGVPAVSSGLMSAIAASGLVATVTPVYPTGIAPATASARLAAVRGWIFTIYQADSILSPVIDQHRGVSVVLAYYNPAGPLTVLARSGPRSTHAITTMLRLGGAGAWSISLSQAAPPGLSATDQALAVFGGGAALSLLLFFLIIVLSRSRARALELVEVRTAQLEHQALHDDLTGLPNRALIFDRAEQMLRWARRDGTSVAALFVDIDQFKDVNEALGHSAGDELLRQVGQRLAGAAGGADTIGRFGADEYVVLVEVRGEGQRAEHAAEVILSALREPFALVAGRDTATAVSVSIGLAVSGTDSAEGLMRDAEIALAEAKATNRGNYVVFSPEMRESLARRLELEVELREALAEKQFFLVYQPIFDLSGDRVLGAEALVRWRHPTRGVVMPGEFVPILESTGMIVDVGAFVLEQACRQAAEWRRRGHPLTISVNASGWQLEREDFVDVVRKTLASTALPADALTIEITETTLMRNAEHASSRLRELKRVGVSLAVDDFGTGYSSLSYLQQFPVDELKVDRSFVSAMDSPDGAALVHTILDLARQLHLHTVAEGIETVEQLRHLRSEGCAAGQGYLLARPIDDKALEDLLARSGEDDEPHNAVGAGYR